jgi:hypothetical protein
MNSRAKRIGRACKQWWKHRNKLLTGAFLAICVGLGGWGLALLPASSGPTPISADPQSPEWNFGISPHPVSEDVSVWLFTCSAGACAERMKMLVYFDAEFGAGVKKAHINAALTPLAGVRCPRPTHFTDFGCGFEADFPVSGSPRSGGYELKVLWPTGIFYSKSGAFTNAEIPGVLRGSVDAPLDFYQSLTVFGPTTLPVVSMLQGPNPTTSTGLEVLYRRWSWDKTTRGGEVAQKAFSLTDVSELHKDTNHVFYSGILFGVAGAAFIAFVEQLLKPPEPDTPGPAKPPAPSGEDADTPEPDTPGPGKPPAPSGEDADTPEPDTPGPGKVEGEGELPDDSGFLDEDVS